MRSVLKALSIIFYILAGFFTYMISLIAFFNMPDEPCVKWVVIGVILVPLLVFMLIGMALNLFRNWRLHLGIVLLSGSGFTAFVTFTMACLMMSDEFRKLLPSTEGNPFDTFSDYIPGIGIILAMMLLGILLIKLNPKATKPQPPDGTTETD